MQKSVLSVSTAGLKGHDQILVRSLCMLLSAPLKDTWVVTDASDACHVLLLDPEAPDAAAIRMQLESQEKTPLIINVRKNPKADDLAKPIRSRLLVERLNLASEEIRNNVEGASIGMSTSTVGGRAGSWFKAPSVKLVTESSPFLARLKSRLSHVSNQEQRDFTKVVFLGAPGAGKTTAIASASDSPIVTTDVKSTDEVGVFKRGTTIAMDYGVARLAGGHEVRMFGAPGQERLDFMWPILTRGASLIVFFVDIGQDNFERMIEYYASFLKNCTTCLAFTHVDIASKEARIRALKALRTVDVSWNTYRVDCREKQQVRSLLMQELKLLDAKKKAA